MMHRLRRLRAAGTAAVLALSLAACAANDEAPEYQEEPVEKLYNEAMDLMQDDRFKPAAERFDEVERQHPYSVWATKAQLMAGFAHYQDNAYDDAIVALDRFVKLHPGHDDVPYAYYLRALCYYEQISDVGRDQKMTRLAMSNLQDLVTRFPDTEYARDARLKIDLTRDHLAGKHMTIARWYERQRMFLPAINRFKTVVKDYQTTSHVPEALHRLVESYLSLGLQQEARRAAAVLGHNFPGSEWYEDSYALLAEDYDRPGPEGENSWLGWPF